MSDQSLMVRDDKALAISFTPEAQLMLTEALESAAMIAKVDSAISQELAVDAQKSLARITKLVEDARKEVKAPVIAFGKAIDDAAKTFVKSATEELTRVSTLIGDFHQAELAKQRSAEAAQKAELDKVEKAREEALSKADTIDQREAIREEYAQLAAVTQTPTVAPARVEGQRIVEDWEFEVVNPAVLAQMHPTLVKIEPRKSEIKDALKMGQTIQGIRAWKTTRATVRLEREQKAIAA